MNKKHMIVRVASVHIRKQEDQLDRMVRIASMKYEAGLKEEMKSLFLKYIAAPLDKYRRQVFTQPLDDVMDDVIKGIAPEITENIREHEVDQDFDHFKSGVQERIFERRAGIIYNEPYDKDEFFIRGYAWGEKNFDLVNTRREGEIPVKVKKDLILESARIHEGLVTERALTLAMKKAWKTINPVEILKHIGHLLHEHGWKVDETEAWYIRWPKRLVKLSTTALAIAIVEMLEHYVLPYVVVTLTGNPAWWSLGTLPLLEIIFPIVASIFKKSENETQEEVDGHLDWFEKQYGDIDAALPKKASSLKLSPHELQDLIKEISDLTEWNAHTDAVVLLAENFGDRSDQDDANYVKTVHKAQGHMPRDVTDFRYKLLKKLLSKAKRVLPTATYMELHQAF